MLFSVGPKERREDLYNFDNELEKLLDAYRSELVRLIVIKGLRRTGKSSLLRVSLNMSGLNYILVDMREFEIPSKVEIYNQLKEGLLALIRRRKSYIMERIKSVSIGGIKIELREPKKENFKSLLRKIDQWCEKNNTYFIFAIDEAQELTKIGFDRYIAFIYDNLSRVKTVLAGSQVGMINKLFESATTPLFGRAREEITTRRFSRDEALDFLQKGFKELNMNVPEDYLIRAVNLLNGLVGWLVLFGVNTYRTKNPEVALEYTVKEGIKLTVNEIEKFLDTRGIGRRRYINLLKVIGEEKRKWKEVKELLEMREGKRLGNNQVSHYLKELLKYGIIEKKDGLYYIPDPLLRLAVMKEL